VAEHYKHTQIGYLILVMLGADILAIILLMATAGLHWIAFAVLVIIVASLALFATLTVEMSKDALEIRFGPGAIRKRFPMEEIASCRMVKNPWYYGWGIRLTPHGWLYNVSGLRAVELQTKSGRKYRIGTDDAEGLVKAIRQSIGGRGASQ